MYDYKKAAMDKRSCPHCGAKIHEQCWSKFLNARMVNEIHRERLYPN